MVVLAREVERRQSFFGRGVGTRSGFQQELDDLGISEVDRSGIQQRHHSVSIDVVYAGATLK